MHKTALVLSGGGQWGAYQAGVWRAIGEVVRPDIVVGTSVGCLNGWLIASGVTGDELAALWRTRRFQERLRLRIPRHWHEGFLDTGDMQEWIRELAARAQPRCEFGVVTLDLGARRQRLHRYPQAGAAHLAASCALPGLLPLGRLDGAWHADGGLLDGLNLWAAVEMGATRIVAVNALQWNIGPVMEVWYGFLRRFSRHRVERGAGREIVWIAPRRQLGPYGSFVRRREADIARWLEQGREDGEAKKHFLRGMFETRCPSTGSGG
jgi:NTE family protein